MLNIKNLKFARESFGPMMLIDVMPAYEYKNEVRTDNVVGYRYMVALPEHNFEKISVKIPGKKLAEKPDVFEEVEFEGFEASVYFFNNKPMVYCKATGLVKADTIA